MGIKGTLEYLSGLLDIIARKPKKYKQLRTVELWVRMDCNGCEAKVKRALSSMKGVKSVVIDRKHQWVTVTGYMEPKKVLARAKSTGKHSEKWPYVPYNDVTLPRYVAGNYDKNAPPGYIKPVADDDNAAAPAAAAHGYGSILGDEHTNMFSDDNTDACSIM